MPDCGFDTVRRVAHVVREVLDELGAVGWPKTSGGKGMHIYVRITPRWDRRPYGAPPWHSRAKSSDACRTM